MNRAEKTLVLLLAEAVSKADGSCPVEDFKDFLVIDRSADWRFLPVGCRSPPSPGIPCIRTERIRQPFGRLSFQGVSNRCAASEAAQDIHRLTISQSQESLFQNA